MNWRRSYHESQATYAQQWREWKRTAPGTVIRIEGRQKSWVVGDLSEAEIPRVAREVAEHDVQRAIRKWNEQQGDMKIRKGEAA